jgi:hypothetical protein
MVVDTHVEDLKRLVKLCSSNHEINESAEYEAEPKSDLFILRSTYLERRFLSLSETWRTSSF